MKRSTIQNRREARKTRGNSYADKFARNKAGRFSKNSPRSYSEGGEGQSLTEFKNIGTKQ